MVSLAAVRLFWTGRRPMVLYLLYWIPKVTLGIFSVWFLLAIFLRFRWGSAVLTRVFFRVSEALLVLETIGAKPAKEWTSALQP